MVRKISSSESLISTPMDLIVVSFNNADLIRYQIALIKQNVIGNYCHIVCDNSNDENMAAQIQAVCVENDVTYIRLLLKPLKKPSLSHGTALNWIYNNIVRQRKNDFAFLDHDIFPIIPFNLKDYLGEQNMNGIINYRMEKWYLWAGFCFYKYDFVKDKALDFCPKRRYHCDTGGANWDILYKFVPQVNVTHCKYYEVENFGLADLDSNKNMNVVCFDNGWMHIVAASGWNKLFNKNEKVYAFLDTILEGKKFYGFEAFKNVKPRVSVLMVVDKFSPNLKRAVSSIIGQSLDDLELLIADVSGNDEVRDILLSYKYNHMKIYDKVADLFKNAKADFITFQEIETSSFYVRLEQQFIVLQNNQDINLCVCGYEFGIGSKEVIPQNNTESIIQSLPKKSIGSTAFMIKKEILSSINLPIDKESLKKLVSIYKVEVLPKTLVLSCEIPQSKNWLLLKLWLKKRYRKIFKAK